MEAAVAITKWTAAEPGRNAQIDNQDKIDEFIRATNNDTDVTKLDLSGCGLGKADGVWFAKILATNMIVTDIKYVSAFCLCKDAILALLIFFHPLFFFFLPKKTHDW